MLLESAVNLEEDNVSKKLFNHIGANAVAYLALFIALGGTSYAAATIGSSQVVNESLTTSDLKDDQAVRSRDVRDDRLKGGGLRGQDIRENTLGTVPRAQGAESAKTVADGAIDGSKVATDSLGGDHLDESTLERVPTEAVVRTETASVAPGAVGGTWSSCEDDERVVGGGGSLGGFHPDNRLVASSPVHAVNGSPLFTDGSSADAWRAQAFNGDTTSQTLTIYAVCAPQ